MKGLPRTMTRTITKAVRERQIEMQIVWGRLKRNYMYEEVGQRSYRKQVGRAA
jgi:hypothetical protein